MSLLSSFIPGRFRLRSSLLQWEPAAQIVLKALQACPAVKNVDHNPATGSALVTYSPTQLSLSKAMSAAPLLDRIEGLEKAPRDEGLLALLHELCDQLLHALS